MEDATAGGCIRITCRVAVLLLYGRTCLPSNMIRTPFQMHSMIYLNGVPMSATRRRTTVGSPAFIYIVSGFNIPQHADNRDLYGPPSNGRLEKSPSPSVSSGCSSEGDGGLVGSVILVGVSGLGRLPRATCSRVDDNQFDLERTVG